MKPIICLVLFLFWLFIYVLLLGLFDIRVEYKNGLTIKFNSWLTMLRGG